MINIDELKALLKDRLNEKRFYHSLCVADAAKELAEIYGEDTEKAYFSGLIHDIMRNSTQDEMNEYIEKYAVELDDVTKNSTVLWHAVLGADYINRILGVNDQDIINAVRYHTTSRYNSSLLEKIIFLADCSSADRNYWNVDDIRKIIRTDINKAMYEVLDYTVNDIKNKGLTVHPDTLAAYEEFNSFKY